jgi:hypothetical protein
MNVMMMKFITPEGRAYRALYYILHNQCLQSIHERLKAPTNLPENSGNLSIISLYSSNFRSVCCRRPWRRFFKCSASLLQRLKQFLSTSGVRGGVGGAVLKGRC